MEGEDKGCFLLFHGDLPDHRHSFEIKQKDSKVSSAASKSSLCSYLHSPIRISVNCHKIKISQETISAREQMIAELESVAKTDPK